MIISIFSFLDFFGLERMYSQLSDLRLWYIVFLLNLWPSIAFCQLLNPSKTLTQYNVDQWSGDEFPSSGIIDMIQTSDGYLWMATFNGLIRFDGVSFTKFDKFNVSAFTESSFRSLYQEKDGNLWVGGNGSGLYLRTAAGFSRFEIPFGASSNNIKCIYTDSQKRLWLGTLRGLVLYKDSTFNLIMPDNFAFDADFPVHAVEEDLTGNIWVATGNGLFIYKEGKLMAINLKGGDLEGEVMDILIDKNKVWVASYGNGVCIIENEEVRKFEPMDTLSQPNTLYKDKQDNIWVGTEMGVARYNDSGVSIINAETGLSHNNVNTIIEDHEGSIWIGTYYGGLNRIRDGAFTNYTELNGLSSNTAHCIFQSSDGTMWVGTENGLNYYDGQSAFITVDALGLSTAKVRDVFEDSHQNLWIATYSGLVKMKGSEFQQYTIADGLASNQTRLIFEDNKQRLWVGTRSGLNLFEDGLWKKFTNEDGLVNDFIISIIQGSDDEILIGTTGGLHIMKGQTIQLYEADDKTIRSTIFRMYKDRQGIIWAGTNNGLICIKQGRIYSFSLDHKLLGANIYQIIEDNTGYFWLTSDKGIVRIARQALVKRVEGDDSALQPTLFDKSNGLRTNEVTAVSNATQTLDGTIWFATLEGVSLLNPKEILINEIPPPIVIHNVLVAGVSQAISGTVTIPPNTRNIEIHYAGLSYMIPKKVRFKYMLEGYDDTWNDVDDRRVAYYTSLPPGEYTFKLAACNNDGIWNVNENALSFIVEKAFWQTNMFYFMSAIGLVLIVVGVIDFRTRRVKHLNRALEDKITERTREVLQQKEEIETQRDYIEAKNRELENARNVIAKQYKDLQEINENLEEKVNTRTTELQKAYTDLIHANKELDDFVYKSAHDIKGPLARLQGLCNLALIETKDPSATLYIKKLERESALANRILEKLSHAHEVKNAIPTIDSVNLYDLILEVLKMLKGVDGAEQVDFHINVAKELVLKADKKLMKELLYNVLGNTVIFRSSSGAAVEINANTKKTDVLLSVKDNGIPVDADVKPNIFKMFVKGSERSEGLGLGLYVAKKAAEGLKGNIALRQSDDSGNIFDVRIPLG